MLPHSFHADAVHDDAFHHDRGDADAHPGSRSQARGVVVLGELFGITLHVRGVAETLTRAGHAVAVVDLFAPLGVTEPLPEDDAGRARGFELLGQISMDRVLADVRRAAGALGPGPVALLGLSAGAYLGLRLLTDATAELPQIERAALLYPGWLDTPDNPLRDGVHLRSHLPHLRVPCLVLTGSRDALVHATSPTLLDGGAARASSHLAVEVIPGAGHGFLAEHRPTYDESTAARAWGLVVEFLR